jgi:hypothetical protein
MAEGGSDGQSSQGVTPDGGDRGAGSDSAAGNAGDAAADSAGASVHDAGPDVVVTVAADGGISVPPGYMGMPYGGTPQVIPGVISAIQYDVGGNNVAFSYAGTVNQCAQRSTGDCIGIASFGNGQVTTTNMPEASTQSYVGWTKTGEWIHYTVQVTEPGTYAIGAHLSAANTGAKVSFGFSPDITTGPLDVPTTAGYVPGVEVYHVWERLGSMALVTLPAGVTVLTFQIEAVAGLNVESFTFTKM